MIPVVENLNDGLLELEVLCARAGVPCFEIALWDGSVHQVGGPAEPAFRVVFRRPRGMEALLFLPNSLLAGEAYARGDWDIEGDFQATLDAADRLAALGLSAKELLRFSRLLFPIVSWPRIMATRTAARARAWAPRSRESAVASHYDHPSELFRPWLGPSMAYTCAVYEREDEGLESAQRAKFDAICDRLQLTAGDRLLDLGCGWGGLSVYAAKRHGARVLGVTLSPSQAEHARQSAELAGVGGTCEFLVCDFRAIREWGRFDKIASIEAFESLRARELSGYFDHLHRLLRPGGRLMNQGVAALTPPPRGYISSGRTFVNTHVFPDHHPHTLGAFTQAAERAGFVARAPRDLGPHYTLTLRDWVASFRKAEPELAGRFGTGLTRTFRLYLERALNSYVHERLTVYQSLFVKPCPDGAVGPELG